MSKKIPLKDGDVPLKNLVDFGECTQGTLDRNPRVQFSRSISVNGTFLFFHVICLQVKRSNWRGQERMKGREVNLRSILCKF